MARVYASMTGREALPDLGVLVDPRARDRELRGILREAELSPRWDAVKGEPLEDHGTVGVDERGVWVSLHPDIILAGMPDAAEAIDRWRGGFREVAEDDSAYLRDMTRTMNAAHARRRRGDPA